MNKLKLILLICVLFISSYYFSTNVKNTVLGVNDFVINKFYDTFDTISNNVKSYFNQIEQINSLQVENNKLKKYEILYNNLLIEYKSLLKAHNLKEYEYDLKLARILSYEKMNELNKFWVSYGNIQNNKTYGLIYNNSVVGVMYSNNDRAYALSLNSNQCAFSVRVGENNVPAIVQGTNNASYVNFIRDYESIKVGDKVYTSGMDGIFVDGIYVGTVSKIIDEAGYKKALLEDTKMLRPYRYVYVIDIKQ
ncbi:rod shape-determining protein MreC [Campylobacter sp. MG1]|uniref:rod shape-determining protein MreC n=1 Tax=Campylobacter sp. MG1 TaxID=2976332 RepID=UPI00226C9363|nr:rod shape-determining protein MreC [Campylobacter sp. MG1]